MCSWSAIFWLDRYQDDIVMQIYIAAARFPDHLVGHKGTYSSKSYGVI